MFRTAGLGEVESVSLMGPKLGSTGELGRMESPGSKRRYREENDNCKCKRSARDGTSSLRTARVGNLPSNRKVALTSRSLSH
jgi:hypothetical protein